MRYTAKPIAKLGISKAYAYRSSVFSFATDLEAMVDAYGAEAVAAFAMRIHHQFVEHGTSTINAAINIEANQLPFPKVRHKAVKKDKRRSKFAKAA